MNHITQNAEWALYIGEINLFNNARFLRKDEDGDVWESLTKVGNAWVRIRGKIYSNNPLKIYFYVWSVYGDVSEPSPLFDRQNIVLHSTVKKIPSVSLSVGFDGGKILHGQGVGLRHFTVDFSNNSVTYQRGSDFEDNDLIVRTPNRTGGLWPRMGLTHDFREKSRIGKLYQIGCYGGHFIHRNGNWLTELDKPDLQADSHIAAHSKDKGWIIYTNPDTPWRDRMAEGWRNEDAEHLCDLSLLAQAYMKSKDEGLLMLLEAGAYRFLRLIPAVARGTSDANSPQHRAKGRILMTGTDVYEALLPVRPKLANEIGTRTIKRLEIDWERWQRLEKANEGRPWERFGSKGHSPSEIGIHYWGLHRLHNLVEKFGYQHIGVVHAMKEACSRYCFDSFTDWLWSGNREFETPYVRYHDGSPWQGPISSSHFAYLAAINHEPQNQSEREKMDLIVQKGGGYAERFKG